MDETLISRISATWSSCDIERQCQLIRQFLRRYGRGNVENWLPFLMKQFAFDSKPQNAWSDTAITEEDILRQFARFEHEMAPPKSTSKNGESASRPRTTLRPGYGRKAPSRALCSAPA